ncbi:hypothetical protein N864_23450 [Intrasporangium chromatireducens Q5-1]|uniref:Uncharacterized protein n=1 Tax=Intrasporangium chromatireducens Q5-1 TaxID=584657 RepID=W9GNB7_9MICO|nr:hypothetical protein N864_23450 [Intrasporangium chromatireducens Q5-1]
MVTGGLKPGRQRGSALGLVRVLAGVGPPDGQGAAEAFDLAGERGRYGRPRLARMRIWVQVFCDGFER